MLLNNINKKKKCIFIAITRGGACRRRVMVLVRGDEGVMVLVGEGEGVMVLVGDGAYLKG